MCQTGTPQAVWLPFWCPFETAHNEGLPVSPTLAQEKRWIRVCAAAELPEGESRLLELKEEILGEVQTHLAL